MRPPKKTEANPAPAQAMITGSKPAASPLTLQNTAPIKLEEKLIVEQQLSSRVQKDSEADKKRRRDSLSPKRHPSFSLSASTSRLLCHWNHFFIIIGKSLLHWVWAQTYIYLYLSLDIAAALEAEAEIAMILARTGESAAAPLPPVTQGTLYVVTGRHFLRVF